METATYYFMAGEDPDTQRIEEASFRSLPPDVARFVACFDAAGSRMLDTWWAADDPARTVTQSLRCYSPADLRSLLHASGVSLAGVEPRGCFDPESREFREECELDQAMQYIAYLRPDSAGSGNHAAHG